MVDTDAKDAEREALEALLVSAGWRHVLAYIDRNWGAVAYRERCRAGLRNLPVTATRDLIDLPIQQVEAVTSAMELLQQYPENRVKALANLKKQHSPRRRPGRGATPND